MAETGADGRALERRIRGLLSQRTDYTSMRGLARTAGIQPNTLTNWYAGTHTPQGVVLQKVADALGVPVSELWDAYEGREPAPARTLEPELADAVERAVSRALAPLLGEVSALRAVLERLAGPREPGPGPQ